jgi:hypothetical protein
VQVVDLERVGGGEDGEEVAADGDLGCAVPGRDGAQQRSARRVQADRAVVAQDRHQPAVGRLRDHRPGALGEVAEPWADSLQATRPPANASSRTPAPGLLLSAPQVCLPLTRLVTLRATFQTYTSLQRVREL